MADYTDIVDPSNQAGTDYTSLSNWEANAASDNSAGAGDTLTARCRTSSSTADDTDCYVSYIGVDSYTIEAYDSGQEAQKSGLDKTRYHFTAILGLRDGGGTVDHIQVAREATYTVSVRIDYARSAGTYTLNGLLLHVGNYNGLEGLRINDADVDVVINNCIFYGSDNKDWAIHADDCNSCKIYNSTVYGFTDGILISNNTNAVTVKNCALGDNTDDIDDSDSSTIDYCCSDDGDGTNSQGPSGDPASWDNEFNDPANGDFTLLTGGNCEDAGVGPGTDSDVPSPDIDGTSRSGDSCDIGADEYEAAGDGLSIPVAMHHYMNNIG